MQIAGLRAPSSDGAPVAIGVMADVASSTDASLVERCDRRFHTTVEANLAGGTLLRPATAAIAALPVAGDMSEGTEIQIAGHAEVMGGIFTRSGFAMGAGILMVEVGLVPPAHARNPCAAAARPRRIGHLAPRIARHSGAPEGPRRRGYSVGSWHTRTALTQPSVKSSSAPARKTQ